MRRVRLLEEAVIEALEAAEYYEQECPGLGVAFYAELDAALDLLEGELVPLVSMPVQFGATDLKRLILARFPYDVVVTDHGDEFLVLAVAHQARVPGYWEGRT